MYWRFQDRYGGFSCVVRITGETRKPYCTVLMKTAFTTFACLLLLCGNLSAQQVKPNEYQVKAVYLYNFGRFVKWPENREPKEAGSFPICILGQDPFGSTLDSTLAGESLDHKPIVIRRISKPQESVNCRILFIHSSASSQLREILVALDHLSILTVSDMPDFSKRGGMIQFVLDGEKVRFEVNLANTEPANLVLSSELLKVAKTVRRNDKSGD